MIRKRNIKWCAIVIGASFVSVQQSALPSTTDFLRPSEVVQGEIVKINADSQHPQVEFTTMDRQRISVAAHSGSSATVGDKVETRSDTQQPHGAKVNTMWDVWGEHLFHAWPFMGLLVAEMRGLAAKWGFKESND